MSNKKTIKKGEKLNKGTKKQPKNYEKACEAFMKLIMDLMQSVPETTKLGASMMLKKIVTENNLIDQSGVKTPFTKE